MVKLLRQFALYHRLLLKACCIIAFLIEPGGSPAPVDYPKVYLNNIKYQMEENGHKSCLHIYRLRRGSLRLSWQQLTHRSAQRNL
jgi:hypothetical protein